MKHLQTYRLFENQVTLTPEQERWLDECTEGKWTLNPQTGLVDVRGNFDCSRENLQDFKGIRFGEIGRNFSCWDNSLTSLEGAPQEVWGGFYCYDNSLTSLEGAPQEVLGDFSCGYNSLTSLEGAPQEVGGGFYCGDNPVSEKTLLKIFQEMQEGHTYSQALKRLALEIPKEDWDLLDKSGVELDAKFAKGASVLRRFL